MVVDDGRDDAQTMCRFHDLSTLTPQDKNPNSVQPSGQNGQLWSGSQPSFLVPAKKPYSIHEKSRTAATVVDVFSLPSLRHERFPSISSSAGDRIHRCAGSCGGSDTAVPDTPPQAMLIGRYAQNVGPGMSEIAAYHAESQSAFITVDSATSPSAFQRVSLRGMTSAALVTPTTASNPTNGAITWVATHVNDRGFTAGGIQTLAISGNLLAIAVQATPKTDNGVVAY